MTVEKCPTPKKVAYRFKAGKAALRQIQQQHRDTPGRLSLYKCPCGLYHLCHVPAPPRRAARAAS